MGREPVPPEALGRFIRLCAGRSGQLLNLSGLASDCGISHTTARRWLSVLEASFIVALLRPHHKNYKRIDCIFLTHMLS
jgi:hypothetical protein